VIEAKTLFPRTSSQQAELIALTQALVLAKDKIINIYTDSRYTYNIIHANVLIWRERGFLTQQGTPIINGELINKLLQVATLPAQIAIIHCRGHQRNGKYLSQANNQVDQLAKKAALGFPIPQHLFLNLASPSIKPRYSLEELI
jgi:ribonuclease HI